MSGVHFKGVNKRYGDAQHGAHIVRDLDLVVRPGEFMVLVGPSGCGKSTTLRMLAGLEELSAGQIFIGERDVTQVPPAQRDVAMVFQSYALYPHMTVGQNMGFSLRMAGRPKAEIEAAVNKAARILQLEPLLGRRPRELSGGQRQRVAIGRAIVREPKVFLFDEPLSNLDAALRTQTRLELARLHEQLGATVIYVTHDQVEAMTLGQRIAIFNQGRIEQVGSPLEVYQRPSTRFVAGFMGSPRINFLPIRLCGALTLPHVAKPEQIAELAVRPEHLRLLPLESAQGLQGTLDVIEHLGDTSLAYVRLNDLPESLAVKLDAAAGQGLQRGQALRLFCEPQHLIPFDAAGLSLLQ